MSSSQSVSYSGSDCCPRYAITDERKRKRMESNRESARRSRIRKQKLLDDLINQTSTLKNENVQLVNRISEIFQKHFEVESKNNVLRSQLVELTDRLRSLNSVLHMAKEAGLAIDIPEIPDRIMKAWQLPQGSKKQVLC